MTDVGTVIQQYEDSVLEEAVFETSIDNDYVVPGSVELVNQEHLVDGAIQIVNGDEEAVVDVVESVNQLVDEDEEVVAEIAARGPISCGTDLK